MSGLTKCFLPNHLFIYRRIHHSGCKESQFTPCHLGKLLLVCASPRVFLTSPKNFFDKQHWLQFFCNLNFPKNFTCPLGKLRTEFTSPITKSTSPGLLDTIDFLCTLFITHIHLSMRFLSPLDNRYVTLFALNILTLK